MQHLSFMLEFGFTRTLAHLESTLKAVVRSQGGNAEQHRHAKGRTPPAQATMKRSWKDEVIAWRTILGMHVFVLWSLQNGPK